MPISLLKIWKESMHQEQRPLLPEVHKNYNDKTMQSSFEFRENLKIVFITDKSTMAPVKHYNKLPAVNLSDDEREIVYHITQDIIKRGNYDGLHILCLRPYL